MGNRNAPDQRRQTCKERSEAQLSKPNAYCASSSASSFPGAGLVYVPVYSVAAVQRSVESALVSGGEGDKVHYCSFSPTRPVEHYPLSCMYSKCWPYIRT